MINRFKELKQMEPILPDLDPNIKYLENIKAVLFDIYGTLIISSAGDIFASELHAKRVVHALEEVGVMFKQGIDFVDLGAVIIGEFREEILSIHDKLRTSGIDYPEVDIVEVWKCTIMELHESGLISDVPLDLDYKLLSLTFEVETNPVWPMPGFQDIINNIDVSGRELGIISNSQFFTPMIVNYFLQEENFLEQETIKGFREELCIYSFKQGCAKPCLSLYEKGVDVLKNSFNIEAQEVLYVGNDMLNDIYGASKVGFRTALFAGDVRSLRLRKNHKEVHGLEPDVTLTELGQLNEVLGL